MAGEKEELSYVNRQVKTKRKLKKKRTIIILSICFFCALLIGFIGSTFFAPEISLNGNQKVFVSINGEYVETGVKATYHGKNITKQVKVTGNVNTDKEGTYKIVYSVKKGVFEKTVTRTVVVKDLEEPELELTGGDEVYVCEGDKYKEVGYKANDNVDGDITDKVKINEEENQITYTVEDKEGNKTEKVRKIIYKDTTKPQLKLIGGSVISMYVNSNYKELGYKATDNCDDDLTDSVRVLGSVNPKKVGSYILTYVVSDKAGNKTSIKRTVNVTERIVGGTIYLTFDDGPKQGTTNVILDILKEEGVKATFFVTNGGPDSLIKREYDEGHTVALHTASHNYATVYSSVNNYFKDLQSVHDRVERLTGYDARIIRFPGGSSNTVSRKYQVGIMSTLTKEVINRGYHYFDWNVTSGDAGETTDSNVIYRNVINNLSRHRSNVVLMHDIKTYTRDAVRRIIRYGKENGYTFARITMDTPMVHHGVNN